MTCQGWLDTLDCGHSKRNCKTPRMVPTGFVSALWELFPVQHFATAHTARLLNAISSSRRVHGARAPVASCSKRAHWAARAGRAFNGVSLRFARSLRN